VCANTNEDAERRRSQLTYPLPVRSDGPALAAAADCAARAARADGAARAARLCDLNDLLCLLVRGTEWPNIVCGGGRGASVPERDGSTGRWR
jgi:hypothetical protein